jgi:PKD repeat protein
MANGSGLVGATGNHNNVLIIKQPSATNIYYVFHLKPSSSTMPPNSDGLYYSIVDMGLASGQGSVTIKNVLVLSGSYCHKLAGTRHVNGKDFWIVIKECSITNTNIWNGIFAFNSFLLSATGVSSVAAVSNFTYANTAHYANAVKIGQMKISPNGSKLACANYGFNVPYNSSVGTFEIYDFNNSTGQVSNYVPLYKGPQAGNTHASGFGVEFSPDASRLYGTLSNNYNYPAGAIVEWDLCSANNNTIATTETLVPVPTMTTINGFGCLQLAPDGKIYVARYFHDPKFLSVIHNPNSMGPATAFSLSAVTLSPGSTLYHLPAFVGSDFFQVPALPSFTLSQVNSTTVCHQVQFTAPPINSVFGTCPIITHSLLDVTWDFGDPASGNNTSTITSPSHNYTAPGMYTVTLLLNFGGGMVTQTQTVSVAYTAGGQLNYSKELKCYGASTGTASYSNQSNSGLLFLWTNGTNTYTTATVSSLGAGSWTSIVTNTQIGCSSPAYFTITAPPAITATLSSPIICQNATLNIQSSGGTGAHTYLWPGGSTSSVSAAPIQGQNSVKVTDSSGCTMLQTFTVVLPPTISVPPLYICNGNSGTISPQGANNYTYSGGIVVSPSVTTIYTVYAEYYGCYTSTPAVVNIVAPPNVQVTPAQITICVDEPIQLLASGALFYSWSNNEKGQIIFYSNSVPGLYSLMVQGTDTNSCKGLASVLIDVQVCNQITLGSPKQNIGVFPNPAHKKIKVEAVDAKVILSNSLGQVISLTDVDETPYILIPEPGIYFVTIETALGMTSIKIIALE